MASTRSAPLCSCACGHTNATAATKHVDPDEDVRPYVGRGDSIVSEICCRVVSPPQSRYTDSPMSNPTQPNIKLTNTSDYREHYANSVQVRVNVWDFFLVFGTLQQQSETQVEVNNFQGIYLSPQQAKALSSILQQNVAGYESTFGEIKLDPRMMAPGPVH
jgi:Protein of unknown function (DUF3467)